jgi:hypothetical protein
MRISLLHKCNELAPLIPKMQTYGARHPAQMPRWIELQGRRALCPELEVRSASCCKNG